jgi:hypothetical protein
LCHVCDNLGTTIIPLYDPEDLESRLRDCIPAADNAYVDLNAHDSEEDWSEEGSAAGSEWEEDSEYASENAEGTRLKQQVGDMIFAESPVGVIQRSLLEKARPGLVKNRKKHTQLPTDGCMGDVVTSLDALGLVVDDASSISKDDSSCGSFQPHYSSPHNLPGTPHKATASSNPGPAPGDKKTQAAEDRQSREVRPSTDKKIKKSKPQLVDPAVKYAVKNDAKYRMLIAKKRSLEKEPILQFFAETRLTGR